jgi:hypothetical protein
MDHLLSDENELVGRWCESEGKIQGDAVCRRIERLTGGILQFVQSHPEVGAWRRLFCDTSDGRYWERYYPQSELHGGGPPALRLLSDEELATEYGITA